MINYINSRTNKKVVYAAKLKNKNYIKEYNEFLLEGYKAIELALKANLVKEIFTIKELKLPYNIVQNIVSEEIIEKLSISINPEGVVAIVKCLEEKEPAKMNKVVYFDDISDPGNMGTLIRTALAFNYDAIVLSKNCVSIYNSKVVAAAKGAMFLIPILNKELIDIKNGRTIITSTLNDKSINLDDLKKPESFVLVLGNEAHGVKEETIKNSDIFVKIPISNIDSLNVAIAGGILMNHLK